MPRRPDNPMEAALDRLAAAQARTTEHLSELAARVDQLAARVDALAEAQRRTEERLEALAARVDQLADAQLRTERRLDDLASQVARLTGVLGDVKGELLEMRYREKAAAYFQRLLLGVRSVPRDDLEEVAAQAERRGELSRSDHEDLLQVDVVVRGHLRHLQADGYAVVEVSSQIDATDVERAARRAQILHRLVQAPVVAAVAGATIGREAAQHAVRLGVWQVVDGRVVAPDAATEQHIG
ncbi:MAG: hypothetical protein QN162_05430 [Armatimonadota bacterium]|nr:hypothetical protein [Armatimonadota bacterium]